MRGCNAADAVAPYDAPPCLVRHTNRPFGHQIGHTKRLASHAIARIRAVCSTDQRKRRRGFFMIKSIDVQAVNRVRTLRNGRVDEAAVFSCPRYF